MGVLECLACALVAGQRDHAAGTILETAHFHAHQDYAVPIPGFVIVSTRRHLRAFDEFNAAELAAFGPLVARLRQAMRHALGIEDVYVFQNEDTPHHFHLWLFPRYPWMEPFGRRIESVRPIIDHAKSCLQSDSDQVAVTTAVAALQSYMRRFDWGSCEYAPQG